jgi:hypothetical protein
MDRIYVPYDRRAGPALLFAKLAILPVVWIVIWKLPFPAEGDSLVP